MTNDTAPAWKVWGALWTVYIVWGSTYLAIRFAVESIPPLIMSGTRFLAAGGADDDCRSESVGEGHVHVLSTVAGRKP